MGTRNPRSGGSGGGSGSGRHQKVDDSVLDVSFEFPGSQCTFAHASGPLVARLYSL